MTLGLCSLLCASAFALSLFAGTRNITDTDLYRFKWIADPQISPDGSQIAYVLVTVADKHDNYNTALWIVPSSGGTPRQLTAGNRDSAPRWSPDGGTLAFLRGGEKEGKPAPAQIYLLSMRGGEPRPLTDLPKGAGNPVWSPDGKTIAFTSRDSAEGLRQTRPEVGGAERCPRDHPRRLPHERCGLL